MKLTQKRGLVGSKGGWKDFLSTYDRKFGPSLSDPAKRPVETLVDFLKTFSKEEDLKACILIFTYKMLLNSLANSLNAALSLSLSPVLCKNFAVSC